jgi:hypothetical protein
MFPYIYKHNGFLQDYYLFKDQDIELDEFSRQIDANWTSNALLYEASDFWVCPTRRESIQRPGEKGRWPVVTHWGTLAPLRFLN